MTTYKYKSDKVASDAIVRFVTVGGIASIFGVTVPMCCILILWNVTGCGYAGYRLALLLTIPVQLLSWALITTGMYAAFRAYDIPPTPPAKKRKKRKIPRSVGEKTDNVAWYED